MRSTRLTLSGDCKKDWDNVATPTHLINTGQSDMYIGPHETVDDFEAELRALDGGVNCAISLSKLPRPGWSGDFSSSELFALKSFYVQAAGRAEEMTIEIRKAVDASVAQFVVGLPPASSQSEHPEVHIKIGDHGTMVYSNEVFDAQSGAQVFFEYYLTGEISSKYSLRRIEV